MSSLDPVILNKITSLKKVAGGGGGGSTNVGDLTYLSSDKDQVTFGGNSFSKLPADISDTSNLPDYTVKSTTTLTEMSFENFEEVNSDYPSTLYTGAANTYLTFALNPNTGTIMSARGWRSEDNGASWDLTLSMGSINRVKFVKDRFIIWYDRGTTWYNTMNIAVSLDDGKTWSKGRYGMRDGSSYGQYLREIAYNGENFIGVFITGSSTYQAAYSYDGLHWHFQWVGSTWYTSPTHKGVTLEDGAYFFSTNSYTEAIKVSPGNVKSTVVLTGLYSSIQEDSLAVSDGKSQVALYNLRSQYIYYSSDRCLNWKLFTIGTGFEIKGLFFWRGELMAYDTYGRLFYTNKLSSITSISPPSPTSTVRISCAFPGETSIVSIFNGTPRIVYNTQTNKVGLPDPVKNAYVRVS